MTREDRDARLRRQSRETIRYALEGAAKDGSTVPDRGEDESWEELCKARDTLEVLRENEDLRRLLTKALALAREVYGWAVHEPNGRRLTEKINELTYE